MKRIDKLSLAVMIIELFVAIVGVSSNIPVIFVAPIS